MKKLLVVLLGLMSFVMMGQTKYLTTYYSTVSNMVWSQSDQKYLFFELEPRHLSRFEWTFNFNENHTGTIYSNHHQRGEVTKYGFNIYKWEIRQMDDGRDYIWIDAIQVSDSQKVTFIIDKNTYGENLVSLFMLESNKHLTFDNFDE